MRLQTLAELEATFLRLDPSAQREQLKESERQVEAKTRIIGQLEGDGLLALRSGRARTSTDDYSVKVRFPPLPPLTVLNLR